MDHLLLSEREWSDFNTAKTRLAVATNCPLCTQTYGPLFFTAIDYYTLRFVSSVPIYKHCPINTVVPNNAVDQVAVDF